MMCKYYIRRLLVNYKQLLANLSYMSMLQLFILLAPFFTYPYLTRVLGSELYGLVITAQILASYASIVVRFGFDAVSARHVSIYREDRFKLSEILVSILIVRFILWLVCFFLYICVVWIIPIYRAHFVLFIFSYGLTFNVLLFPQFFFQGVEKMKYITFINILIQSIFVVLTFVFIKKTSDYIFVPLLYTIGYLLGGVISLYIIFNKFKLAILIPSISRIKYYVKDAVSMFATDAVCTVKDKLNYLLLGSFVSMGDVVIYDLGSKLVSLAVQPLIIINTVVFPKMAKSTSNILFCKIGLLILFFVLMLVILINIFLEPIVCFFIDEKIPLIPIRVFLISAIFLGLGSYIGSSFIVARGYNKYMFHSIVITVSMYIIMLIASYVCGLHNSVMTFILITVVSYFIEMLYRFTVVIRIIKK